MKKLVFSISLILSYTFIALAGVVKSIPAKADDFTNGNIITVTPSISESDLNNYNNALQVLEYLRQGGSIDFSNVSDNYTSGDLLDEFVDLIDTVGNSIDYYGNNFIDNIFDLSSDKVQLSPNYKLKDRIGQFRSNLPSYLNNNNSDNPIPTPDIQYQYYINYINSYNLDLNCNFINYNASAYNTLISNYDFYFNGIAKEYSWVSLNRYTNLNSPNTFYFDISNSICYTSNGYNYTNWVIPCSPITIYINGNDDNYSFSINCNFIENLFSYPNSTTYHCSIGNFQSLNYDRSSFSCGYVFTNLPSSNISYSGTLERCLMYIVQNFRNVNIYVNGNPWTIPFQPISYNISLGTGTYLKETNQPIEYKFEVPVYVDISDLIDKIQLAIDNKITIDFPYLNDLIVDTNGQQTIAVTVFSEDYTIDDLYVKDYGAMIPLFPLWVEYPVALEHINTVATVGIVDVIPADIIEILGIFLIVGLFVFLCHRLME